MYIILFLHQFNYVRKFFWLLLHVQCKLTGTQNLKVGGKPYSATYLTIAPNKFLISFWQLFDNFWRLPFQMENQIATTFHRLQPFAGWDFWNSHEISWWIWQFNTSPLTVSMFWLAGSYRSQQKLAKSCPEDFKIE